MSESAVVQLRALRAAVANGLVAPFAGVESLRGTGDYWKLLMILHPNFDGLLGCRCDDRDFVLAGLDRLIAEIEAQGVQHV